jgi:hypothetical protein
MDDKQFILRVDQTRETGCRVNDPLTVPVHAAAVVDQ